MNIKNTALFHTLISRVLALINTVNDLYCKTALAEAEVEYIKQTRFIIFKLNSTIITNQIILLNHRIY